MTGRPIHGTRQRMKRVRNPDTSQPCRHARDPHRSTHSARRSGYAPNPYLAEQKADLAPPPEGLLDVDTGRPHRSGTLAYMGPGPCCRCLQQGGMRSCGSTAVRSRARSGRRRATRHAVRLNSARQRGVGGVSPSRRSSILTGWRKSAAESISARVTGQGKLDGSRSGAPPGARGWRKLRSAKARRSPRPRPRRRGRRRPIRLRRHRPRAPCRQRRLGFRRQPTPGPRRCVQPTTRPTSRQL